MKPKGLGELCAATLYLANQTGIDLANQTGISLPGDYRVTDEALLAETT